MGTGRCCSGAAGRGPQAAGQAELPPKPPPTHVCSRTHDLWMCCQNGKRRATYRTRSDPGLRSTPRVIRHHARHPPSQTDTT
eukprot:6271980-Prymnesium_polylepis.2